MSYSGTKLSNDTTTIISRKRCDISFIDSIIQTHIAVSSTQTSTYTSGVACHTLFVINIGNM